MFFKALLQITMEGFFADPMYGGNRNKASWRMIGYPGPAGDLPRRDQDYRGKKYDKPNRSRSRTSRERSETMATKLKEVDAVVVGMGWTGSIMARELTKAGLNVVGLERGAKRSPREDFTIPEHPRRAQICACARSCSRTTRSKP